METRYRPVGGAFLLEETAPQDVFIPEEFSAEDRWAVKDRIGSDLVKLQVVRVDKDAAYFKVDRKFYRIRAGENLAAAMEKPLAETEVKALQLGEP